jgi:hypothetical protein
LKVLAELGELLETGLHIMQPLMTLNLGNAAFQMLISKTRPSSSFDVLINLNGCSQRQLLPDVDEVDKVCVLASGNYFCYTDSEWHSTANDVGLCLLYEIHRRAGLMLPRVAV